MNQLQVKYKGDRSPIALRQQSSPEPYLPDDESDSYEDEDDSKRSAALVAVPPKSSMSRTSSESASGLSNSGKNCSSDFEEDSTSDSYYGVEEDSSEELLADNRRRLRTTPGSERQDLDRHTCELSRRNADRRTVEHKARRHFSQTSSSPLQSTTNSVSGRSFLASRNPTGNLRMIGLHANMNAVSLSSSDLTKLGVNPRRSTCYGGSADGRRCSGACKRDRIVQLQ